MGMDVEKVQPPLYAHGKATDDAAAVETRLGRARHSHSPLVEA